MKINKENYEAYLLDLWEGNLSEDEEAMLNDFLEKHPELDDGDSLALLDDVSTTAPEVEFDQSSLNLDEINEKNHEFFFIAYLEGDLTQSEKEGVDTFISNHPELQKKFNQFKKARLEEDMDSCENLEKDALDFENINIHNYHFFFIAYHEGDLSDSQFSKVDTFVSNHPELAKEFDQFSRAKLPTENVSYPKKSLLMAETTPVISLQSRLLIGVAAASIALFFIFSSPFQSVENRYSQAGRSSIIAEEHSKGSFTIDLKTEVNKKDDATFKQVNSLNSSKIPDASNNSNSSKKKVDRIENEPGIKINNKSRANIKVNDLSNVVASLNKSKSEDQKEQKTNNKANTQDGIPTILEYTTAYLQRKNVLNDERKPNFKGLLNNTLADNRNGQPVLKTTEDPERKRTVFKLGDFKFERIAKK